jgi:trimethylamine:corrinoid methyltransferase-like protein
MKVRRNEMARTGVLVEPYQRLKAEHIERIHRASLAILTDPGVVCYNRRAAEIFGDSGAEVSSIENSEVAGWLIKIPEKVVTGALQAAPGVVKLGARDANNCLILDGSEPRVHFVSGSETNIWLDVDLNGGVVLYWTFARQRSCVNNWRPWMPSSVR